MAADRRRLPLEQLIAVSVWVLVVVNVQPWVRQPSVPQAQATVEPSGAKGALLAATFMVAVVLAAPRFRARMPATYLLYIAYLFLATATAFHLSDPRPPLLRVARLGLAIAIPLLLWSWLAGRPQQFLRAHRLAHVLVGLVVVAGLAAAPGDAWDGAGSFAAGGRLQGVFLPMLPPRVGEIGAVLVGLTSIALVFRQARPLPAGIVIGLGLSLVILSRTRTAAAGLLVGLLVAFGITRKHRLGRRGVAALGVLVLLAVPLFVPLRSWAVREEDSQRLASLTGRTLAWSAVLEQQSSVRTIMLGHGLGNKGVLLRRGEGDFDVMAIDNGWLSLLWETGWLGVGVVLLALLSAVVAVARAPTPAVRAAAGFLLVYVAVSSITETGLSDLSSQTLHVLVAAGAAYADRVLVRGERLMLPALVPARPAAAGAART
jgi:hypothetical protein